jgi:DNA-binding NarL/FixJ family response regulator
MSEPTTILIVDDDPLVRVGLRAVLDAEDDLTVVGEAADGSEAIIAVVDHAPDLVIMDIRMPNLDGLAATRRLMERADDDNPPPRVLVLTTFELDEYVYEALQAGASGFLLKRVPPAELLDAVRIVATGESLVFPAITRKLIEEYSLPDPSGEGSRLLATLTDREREVLRLMAAGKSNAEIADDLYVGHETVKSHVKSVLLKLGVRDRTQAVIAAYETGFVRPGSG